MGRCSDTVWALLTVVTQWIAFLIAFHPVTGANTRFVAKNDLFAHIFRFVVAPIPTLSPAALEADPLAVGSIGVGGTTRPQNRYRTHQKHQGEHYSGENTLHFGLSVSRVL